MALLSTAELVLSHRPDRVVMLQPGEPSDVMRHLSEQATLMAKNYMPKLTGSAASRMQPLWGEGYFGIYFPDSYVWYQDHGIRSFTMKNLEGKTIPMWIDDPSGAERAKNPKAKVRTTATGRVQILIFRKVAKKGQRRSKVVTDSKTGHSIIKSVPASYPGAPGRIKHRHTSQSSEDTQHKPGQISRGNVGVRWRHPGLSPRMFMNHSLMMVAQKAGLLPLRVYACTAGTMPKRF